MFNYFMLLYRSPLFVGLFTVGLFELKLHLLKRASLFFKMKPKKWASLRFGLKRAFNNYGLMHNLPLYINAIPQITILVDLGTWSRITYYKESWKLIFW